jgi:DNA-binding CsgD family transcriptional regulator
MAQKAANPRPEAIVKLLGASVNEPHQFNELMRTWNTLFEAGHWDSADSFADVEAAAITSVAAVPDAAPHAAVGRQVGEMLEKFKSPAYLVRENGLIKAQNSAAYLAFHLGAGATLADLPLSLEMDNQINTVVQSSLEPGKNRYDAILKRAYSEADDRPLTLSITPSKPIQNGEGEALVFVVDARWKTAAAGLIKREFDLTEAERALLEAFLDGQTTQDMATNRNRSHATIRTQFHSLMTKMGARSQTELFRNALSVSQFVDEIGLIAKYCATHIANAPISCAPAGAALK